MKLGDKVGLVSGNVYHSYSIMTIDRETSLYWIVGDFKFKKSNLCQVGLGKWDCCYICELTEDFLNNYLKYKLENIDIQKYYNILSLDNKKRVYDFFKDNQFFKKEK